MNCDRVKEKLDEYDFEKREVLDKDISQHIEGCQSCEAYYISSLQTRKLVTVLQQSEPKLDNPKKLTDDIFSAIAEGENPVTVMAPLIRKNQVIQLAQRILAAASVCLMMVFGIEQYIVVKKINNLENQMGAIAIKNTHFANHASQVYGSQFFNQGSSTRVIWSYLMQKDKNSFIHRFLDAQLNIESTESDPNEILSRVKEILIHNSSTIFSQHIQKYKEAKDD